jgi:hypothetical protein
MARIRSIHPALFTDEAFVSVSMPARVLLMGLWTEADDQGVFDWKPVTIKMRLMPVDNVDIAALLQELGQADVIKQFSEGGRLLGAIRNFCKFQRPKTPKYREIKSTEIRIYISSPYPASGVDEAEREQFPQNGEMPPQMEEEGGMMEEKEEKTSTPAPPRAPSRFDEFWKEYPQRDGDNPRKTAEKKFNALVKTGVDPDLIIAGAKRAAHDARRRNVYGTQYVPQAIKWLNDQRFLDIAVDAFAGADDGMVEVLDQLQLEAWDAYGLQHRGKKYPRDKKGGWRFPSKWPPGYEPNLIADVNDMSIQ